MRWVFVSFFFALFLLTGCRSPTPEAMPVATQAETSPAAIPTIEFYSESGGYYIDFPITDRTHGWHYSIRELSIRREILGEPALCQAIFVRGDGALWKVEYCDYSPDIIDQFSPEDVLDKARDEALKAARGKIVSETDIAFGSYPGREIVADSARRDAHVYDGLLRARLFLANGRIYIVETYVHNENWGDTMRSMEPFLNSFYIEQ